MKIAYLDIFFGISGDMTLGALVDAGVDADELIAELKNLDIEGWEISFEKVKVSGLGATRATVSAAHEHHRDDHGMDPGQLIEIIERASLNDSVKQRAVAVIERVAEAEAEAHRVPITDVHFHELGGLDTIIDVAGAIIGFDLLGVERVYSSPIPVSHGFVNCAHGRLPVPVPAVVNLLKGVPTIPLDVAGETVTPTGAAIATVLSSGFGTMPAMTLLSSGFGAGHKEFPEAANLLRIIVGEAGEARASGRYEADVQILIEANIDDMNPELYEAAQQAIFEAGAVDCWFTPIFMKKNRPAVKLSALAAPGNADAVADAIMTNTTTFGVRRLETRRDCLARETRHVDTAYGTVGVKVGMRAGEIITVSPEFADCRRLAAEHAVAVKTVYQAAVAAAAALLKSP